MGISGFFGKRNISAVDIDIQFSEEKYAGKEFPLKILIKNQKRFLPSILIKVHIEDKQVLIPYIKTRTTEEIEILYLFENRGVGKIENIYICSVFPFNFFVRCFSFNKKFETIVFPKPEKCSLYQETKSSKKREKDIGKLKAYEGEIGGLKEYNLGEPIKYIHWKHYAKTGKLFVKELYSDTDRPIIIDFDKLKDKNIEKSLSCATYLINSFYKKKIPVGLKIGNKIFKPSLSYGHKISMLKELALYV
ncbi:DUF58 domain-containing protein [Hydrogenothermus marinus]|uniref:DUF58 domain-containing protein n=1 Tax=Hydrogenothermus marinus TaxID=133270 RepID=UPI000EF976E7|nr:DUF58 domain-containing protein [Hydrogenothermus marinus]